MLYAGLFISLMLHFDARNGSGKRYFYAAMAGYTLGLAITIVVMNVFEAAQPALLYIVPCVCGAVFAQAALRGEVQQLWAFADSSSAEGSQDPGDTAEPDAAATERTGSDTPEELKTHDAGQSAPGFQLVGELKKES